MKIHTEKLILCNSLDGETVCNICLTQMTASLKSFPLWSRKEDMLVLVNRTKSYFERENNYISVC